MSRQIPPRRTPRGIRSPKTQNERALWNRVERCQKIKDGLGVPLMVLAGVLGLAVFPIMLDSPSPASVWSVRAMSVSGWLVVFVCMYFDQRYRGEYIARQKGDAVRPQITRASGMVVLGAAPMVIVTLALYP